MKVTRADGCNVRQRTDAMTNLAHYKKRSNQIGFPLSRFSERNENMNRIIWLVGAVVIVLFVLGYFGLR